MKLSAWSLVGTEALRRLPVPERPITVFSGSGPRWIEAGEVSDEDVKAIAEAMQLGPTVRENLCKDSRTNQIFVERGTLLLEFPCAVDLDCDPHPYVSILARSDMLVTVLRNHDAEATRLHERLRPRLEAGEPAVELVAGLLLEELVAGTMDFLATLRSEADDLMSRVLAAPLRVPMKEIQRMSRRIQHAALIAEDQLFSMDSLAAYLGGTDRFAGLVAMLGLIQKQLDHMLSLATRLAEQLRSTHDHAASARDDLASDRLRLLTLVSAVFLPVNLIAAIYGMNFVSDADHPWNMPELRWRYGYFFSLGVMVAIAAGMMLFFRRRGWFGGEPRGNESGKAGK
jgi:magnesium transporter